MSAQSTINLNTVPHNPRGTESGISTWAGPSDSGDFGGGLARLTESVRGPLADGSYRIRFQYRVPKLATADSACGCIGTILGKVNGFDLTFDVSGALTAAERQDLRKRFQSLATSQVLVDAVDSLTGSW